MERKKSKNELRENQKKNPSRHDLLDPENNNIPDISRSGSPLDRVTSKENVDHLKKKKRFD